MSRPRGCGSALALVAGAIALIVPSCVSWQPSNGGYFAIANRTGAPFTLILEDGPRQVERDGVFVRVNRIYPRGVLKPGATQFFQWPFADGRGRISIIAGADTTRSSWIEPWSKMQWWWDVTPDGFTVRWEDR